MGGWEVVLCFQSCRLRRQAGRQAVGGRAGRQASQAARRIARCKMQDAGSRQASRVRWEWNGWNGLVWGSCSCSCSCDVRRQDGVQGLLRVCKGVLACTVCCIQRDICAVDSSSCFTFRNGSMYSLHTHHLHAHLRMPFCSHACLARWMSAAASWLAAAVCLSRIASAPR